MKMVKEQYSTLHEKKEFYNECRSITEKYDTSYTAIGPFLEAMLDKELARLQKRIDDGEMTDEKGQPVNVMDVRYFSVDDMLPVPIRAPRKSRTKIEIDPDELAEMIAASVKELLLQKEG